jgi:hypothetical protein
MRFVGRVLVATAFAVLCHLGAASAQVSQQQPGQAMPAVPVQPLVPNAGPIPPPVEELKVQSPGLQGGPSTPIAAVPTNLQPSPSCAPGATVNTLPAVGGSVINPFNGQPQPTSLDVCTTPALNCPSGLIAASISDPPVYTHPQSSTYYCCPADKRIYWTNGQCCPQGALPGAASCVPGQPATCGGQAVAIGGASPVCATPALCPRGYTLTGTTCCTNDMVSSFGTCCPPGQPPLRSGGCKPLPPDKNANVPPAPPIPPSVVNIVECPKDRVRRDAFQGDLVCVTRATREQIIVDNTAAPSRTRPNGNCLPGFVWREAGPADHACVPPDSRRRVRIDNQQQCGGDLHCRNGVVAPSTSTRLVVGPRQRLTFRPHRQPPSRARSNKPHSASGHTTAFHTQRRTGRHR